MDRQRGKFIDNRIDRDISRSIDKQNRIEWNRIEFKIEQNITAQNSIEQNRIE